MTMLDRMRRHKNWLKWSLAIVVLAFILLYIPQFMSPSGVGAAPGDAVATVNGRKITAGLYQQIYNQQVAQMRATYGNVDEQMLRQFGLGERLIQQLVSQEAELVEAERLGIKVTDGELRERLVRFPMFVENGQFVGEARYREILSLGRPPLRPADFETDLRQSLVSEKLQAAVTGWIRVSDADVEEQFRRRNEKVQVDLAVFPSARFVEGLDPTEAELEAHYAANQETYRIPEKRRVKYLAIETEALRATMIVTPAEVTARYQQDLQTYSTPEQVRASHILFQTEGKDEAAVRKLAESVLARVKAGADFAALAREYSDDEASRVNGGDLDYFGRGMMVKEFDDVVWSLPVGETSDIVSSPFGLHIIRTTDRREARTRPLEEVRAQIEDQIRFEKAQAEASRLAAQAAGEIDDAADLERVGGQRGWTVRDSGLFSREEPIGGGLGFSPAVANEAFRMDVGGVSDALRTNQGYAIISLAEVAPAYLPGLDEVRARVRFDVNRVKALEIARERAQAARTARGTFAAAVRAAGGEIKSTDLITRGTTYPDVGVSERLDAAVFALAEGEISEPITTENAVVVARVTDREEAVPSALETEREALREELLQQRRGEFFNAYMMKAREDMTIAYNENTIRTLLGQN